METDETQVPEVPPTAPTTQPTPPKTATKPATSPDPVPEPEAVDYKKQFESALRASEKAAHVHDATVAQLNAERQAHETSKTTIDGMKSEMKKINATLSQKEDALSVLQEKVVELEPVRVKAMRLGVILTEFPHLASFEKDGLLPASDTPENLRESLSKFSDRLAELSRVSESSFAAGGKPENIPAPEPKKSSAETARDYLDAAIQSQRSGNMAEYEANFTKFLHEKNKQQV